MRLRKARKTRVSKQQVKALLAEKSITCTQHKRTLLPGPYTNQTTQLKLKVSLRPNQSISTKLGSFLGFYRDTSNWNEKGWYPLSLNLTATNLRSAVLKHSLTDFMIAAELYLNQPDRTGHKPYGDLVLLSVLSDNSLNSDPEHCFVSVLAKTNRKYLPGFAAVRKGLLTVLPKS